VNINYPVDLRLVADCVDATPAQLQQLNPSLLRLSTPKEGTFELHLPAGTKQQYLTVIADIPAGMRLWWRYPAVHPGDTLTSLAHTYHTTPRSIEDANHLDGAELEGNTKLIIPLAPGKHFIDTATYARRITRYKVRRGDTVETVAENFGVSPQMLRRWNGLRGDSLHGRTVLALHLPVSPSGEPNSTASGKPAEHSLTAKQSASAKAPAARPAKNAALGTSEQGSVLHHRVKSGETLYSIATTYKTTVAALKRSNQNVATLRPGMILVVQQNQ
jgi:membrane-bound lytic murein transglycosylase D